MPGVPSQGGGSSWPEGTLSWGSVAGWGPVPEGAASFCLTEVCTRLLFLKLFLIQSQGLWVEGGTGGQLWGETWPRAGVGAWGRPGAQEALLGPEQP